MIYFDNNATTRIDKEVLDAMLPYLTEEYGNPLSKYYTLGVNANKALEDSRRKVANLLNCDYDEIVFTSGSSESNNFIIKGVAESYKNKGNHIITSAIEHESVLETCKFLESKGYDISYLPVNNKGFIDIDEIQRNLRKDTILVSIMWANNEVGSINDVYEIAKICEKNNIFFHTDATQSVGKVSINLEKVHASFLSLSSHKIYGPKGIGITYIRKDELGLPTQLTPLIHGGEQENGYRAGTHALHDIVGLGKAAEISVRDHEKNEKRIIEMENMFLSMMKSCNKRYRINSPLTNKIPGVLNITLEGISNELFIKSLKNDVAISTGSACSIGKPSYVLAAMGIDKYEIRNTIRIAIGRYNTEDDIIYLFNKINDYR